MSSATRWNDATRRAVFKSYCKNIGKHADSTTLPAPGRGTDYGHHLVAGRDFARFSLAFTRRYQREITRQHVDSAYALVCRRIEAIPDRLDRLIVCGMAASAICRSGTPVHLLCDNREDVVHAANWLGPLFAELDYSFSEIHSGDSERDRRQAYNAQITMTTARECAMDFLRDATNWPERGDSEMQKVDRLAGRHARHGKMLLRGLPCAIHVDIDSALIDNARTPIMLTRDSHPMHETDELKRGLEMAGQLENGAHFLLTGNNDEVNLTEHGQAQLDAWGEQLGGIWAIPHIAEMLLKVAILVTEVLEPDKHFRVEKKSVQWLVQQRLVPGLTHFGDAFLSRVLLLHQGQEVGDQREVTGRASYQQIFNRYVHQCGCCHTIAGNRKEFRAIYDLPVFSRWQSPSCSSISNGVLVEDGEALVAHLTAWAKGHNTRDCRLLVCNAVDKVPMLQQLLSETIPAAVVLDPGHGAETPPLLAPGNFLISSASALDRIDWSQCNLSGLRVHALILERSTSLAEDQRNLHWLSRLTRSSLHVSQVITQDCALFEQRSTRSLRLARQLFGVKFGGWFMNIAIRRIQREKGRSLAKMRKELMAYDSSMQGLLSFSGRGLYD